MDAFNVYPMNSKEISNMYRIAERLKIELGKAAE